MGKIRGLLLKDLSERFELLINQITEDLKISEEDLKEKLGEDGMAEFISSFDELVSEDLVNRFTAENFRQTIEISFRNQQKIIEKSEDVFRYYFALSHAAHTIYDSFMDHHKTESNIVNFEPRDITNIVLLGNICRLVEQIGLLMYNGYPDGALILWRTLYEYCVIAVFLMKHYDNQLATRFQDASVKEWKRQVESFHKRHADLKFPDVTPELLNKVEEEFDRVKATYSDAFFKNDYNWASEKLEGKPSFMAIEEQIDFGRYRPLYIMVSGRTHPSYRGLLHFITNSEQNGLRDLTTQIADSRSMIDPAQFSLAILHQTLNHFLYIYAAEDEYDTNMMVIRKMYERFENIIKSL